MRKFLSLIVLLVLAITASAKDVKILIKSNVQPHIYAWYENGGTKVEITGAEPGSLLTETINLKNPAHNTNETYYKITLSYEGDNGVNIRFQNGDQKTQDFKNLKGLAHYFYFYDSNSGNMDVDFNVPYTITGACAGTTEGQDDILFGKAWTPSLTTNDMIEGPTNYYLSKQDIKVTNKNILFKVVANHEWKVSFPESGNNESLLSKIPENGGTFDFNFYFDPTTQKVDASVSQDVTITDALYATFAFDGKTDYSNENTKLKSYRVKLESGKANLYEVTGVLPPNTPVVLKSENAKTVNVYAYDMYNTSSAITDNDLKESDGNVVGDGTIYILAQDENGVVGFRKFKQGSTLAAGKCYLKIESLGTKEFYAFEEGETTGINSFNAETVESSAIYNLQGIQVDNSYKGIVVKNGKKYINK